MAGGNPQDERQANDFYATPPAVTTALLGVETFNSKIHECACGNGAMSMVLQLAGFEVVSTDIRPLGFGSKQDFLTLDKALADTVITNPPFSKAAAFINHGMGTLGLRKMALVLKSTYWHAAGRRALFEQFKPSAVYPLLWRPDFLSKGRPTMEICWTVWDVDHVGATVYRPLVHPDKVKP